MESKSSGSTSVPDTPKADDAAADADAKLKTPKRAPGGSVGGKPSNPRSTTRYQSKINSKKYTGLVVRPTYTNTLPDLPMDPKFVKAPLSLSRFVDYKLSSLELNYQYEMHCGPNMGLHVDLVIPPDRNPVYMPALPAPSLQGRNDGEFVDIEFNEKDAKLLEDEAVARPAAKLKQINAPDLLKGYLHHRTLSHRKESHRKDVAWLRRTEYISTEQTRFRPDFMTEDRMDKIKLKKSLQEQKEWNNIPDHRERAKAIEKTFEDIQKPITEHFSKPGVYAEEVMEVFPDFDLWKHGFVMISFDSDPSLPNNTDKDVNDELASNALIRGVTDDTGDEYVLYFLPNEETCKKIREDKSANCAKESPQNEKYEYEVAREYNYTVKARRPGSAIERSFFVIRDNKMYYNELEPRINLSKRRTGIPCQQVKTKLTATNAPKTEDDYNMEKLRERDLQPPREGDYDSQDENENNCV